MTRLSDLEAKLNSGEPLTQSDEGELVAIAKYYRKLLAMKVAEYAWLEMKNHAQIDTEIKPLGYRLVKIVNSRIPVLEEI